MNSLWLVSSLEQKGSGERFVLEAVQEVPKQGHDVFIAGDRLAPAASFDGRYDLSSKLSPKACEFSSLRTSILRTLAHNSVAALPPPGPSNLEALECLT